jgi:hypothetical protein
MDIGDAPLAERGCELALGEAGTVRGRNRSRVDQEIDLGTLELV